MQVIGIFAVVASLIFVGLQMQQSQEIAIAAQYQERYAVAMQYWQSRGESELKMEQSGMSATDRFGLPEGIDRSIDLEEFGILIVDVRPSLLVFDNMHFQYQFGFITDETWLANRLALKDLLARPLHQYVFRISRRIYRESYAELCETLIEKAQAEVLQ